LALRQPVGVIPPNGRNQFSTRLIVDAELLVDRVVAGECCVGGPGHLQMFRTSSSSNSRVTGSLPG
jgi:hypothetical protein